MLVIWPVIQSVKIPLLHAKECYDMSSQSLCCIPGIILITIKLDLFIEKVHLDDLDVYLIH